MIFGINGQIAAGKDETGRRIINMLPGGTTYRKIAYADMLKLSFRAFFNISDEQLELLKREDNAFIEIHSLYDGGVGQVHSRMSFREALQRFGTEAHRKVFGQSFWVDMTFPPDYKEKYDMTVVCDVRFPDEAERIKELGGKIIRVLDGPLKESDHPSEQIFPDSMIDYEIENSTRDDDFSNLDKQIRKVLEKENIFVRETA